MHAQVEEGRRLRAAVVSRLARLGAHGAPSRAVAVEARGHRRQDVGGVRFARREERPLDRRARRRVPGGRQLRRGAAAEARAVFELAQADHRRAGERDPGGRGQPEAQSPPSRRRGVGGERRQERRHRRKARRRLARQPAIDDRLDP
jgi:hypothetical protein